MCAQFHDLVAARHDVRQMQVGSVAVASSCTPEEMLRLLEAAMVGTVGLGPASQGRAPGRPRRAPAAA